MNARILRRAGLVSVALGIAVLATAGAANAAPSHHSQGITIAWATTNDPAGPEPTSSTVHWPQTLYAADPDACGPPVWLQVDTYSPSNKAQRDLVDELLKTGVLHSGDDSSIGARTWRFVLVKACDTLPSPTPTRTIPVGSNPPPIVPPASVIPSLTTSAAPSSTLSAAPTVSATSAQPKPVVHHTVTTAAAQTTHHTAVVAVTHRVAPAVSISVTPAAATTGLASTGSATGKLLALAAALLVPGGLMLIGSKRRRQH